jgi:hypothetical protein
LLVYLLKPDNIIIDHGHFQYNSLILGLILMSIYCLLNQKYYICCILYTIAIHSKQMSIYYSLAFFSALIGLTIKDCKYYNNLNYNESSSSTSINNNKRNRIILFELVKYGVIVIVLSVIIWIPFILSNSSHLVV